MRAKKWLRLAPVQQKGSSSQARALATPKFNKRGNGRAVNVTPRNSQLEVQFRAFRRALFRRQQILPRFVSLHLVGTGDILLGGGGHSIQGRVRKHSQLPRKLGWAPA